jgi:hypothetical protein
MRKKRVSAARVLEERRNESKWAAYRRRHISEKILKVLQGMQDIEVPESGPPGHRKPGFTFGFDLDVPEQLEELVQFLDR